MKNLKDSAEWIGGTFGGLIVGISIVATVSGEKTLAMALLAVGMVLIAVSGIFFPRLRKTK